MNHESNPEARDQAPTGNRIARTAGWLATLAALLMPYSAAGHGAPRDVSGVERRSTNVDAVHEDPRAHASVQRKIHPVARPRRSFQRGDIVLSGAFVGLGARIRLLDPFSQTMEPLADWTSPYLAFDVHRDRVLASGIAPGGPAGGALFAVDADGGLEVLYSSPLAPHYPVCFAADGAGRIYHYDTGNAIRTIDANGEHAFLLGMNGLPFDPAANQVSIGKDLYYDAASNALFSGATWTDPSCMSSGAPQLRVTKIPLDAGGAQVAGPVQAFKVCTTGSGNVHSIGAGPGNSVIVGSNASFPGSSTVAVRLWTLDPLAAGGSLAPWVCVNPSAHNTTFATYHSLLDSTLFFGSAIVGPCFCGNSFLWGFTGDECPSSSLAYEWNFGAVVPETIGRPVTMTHMVEIP